MGKEITLPWTCETRDKIISGLFWIILISAPFSFIHFLFVVLTGSPGNPILFLEFIYGLFGSVISWSARILLWSDDDKLPSFKCKQPNDREVKS